MKPKPKIVVKPRIKTDRPDLDAMHTRQLIERLRSLRANGSAMFKYWGDPTDEERLVLAKEVDAVKLVLSFREHVPTKAESKLIRQQRAKHGR